MELKKIMIFALLFIVLTMFSLMTLGVVGKNTELVKTVSAIKMIDPYPNNYISIYADTYSKNSEKTTKREVICPLDSRQAQAIKKYRTTEKTFKLSGITQTVYYVGGAPIHKKMAQSLLGNLHDAACRDIYTNKRVLLITPIHVS